MNDNLEYFAKNYDRYQCAISGSKQFYQQLANILYPYLYGNVVDFGNGGIINYPLDNINKLVCQDIVFANMRPSGDKVDFIFGDFYEPEPVIQPDVVLVQFLLHHLLDDQRLLHALGTLKHCLQPGGRLVIAEVKLPEFVFGIQTWVLPVLTRGLRGLNKPGVRFFSKLSLSKLLNKSGFYVHSSAELRIKGWVHPAPVIWPSLKIPGRSYPFKIMIVEALPDDV